MNYDLIIARYGEIGLKSPKIRSRFERKLVKNIKATFECEVDRNQGRIYIHPEDFKDGVEKLNRVFGVVSYSPATSTKTTYEDIDETLTRYVEELVSENLIDEDTKFAIKCRRVGKHDFTSQEMAAHCGGVVRNVVLAPVVRMCLSVVDIHWKLRAMPPPMKWSLPRSRVDTTKRS